VKHTWSVYMGWGGKVGTRSRTCKTAIWYGLHEGCMLLPSYV